MNKKDLIGKRVIWTKTEPGKRTERVITKIADVHNLLLSLEGYPGIYFFLDGRQARCNDNCISKVQLIDESYAEELNRKWQEDSEKKKLIKFIIDNQKYLIVMPIEMVESFANELETHLQKTVLS